MVKIMGIKWMNSDVLHMDGVDGLKEAEDEDGEE